MNALPVIGILLGDSSGIGPELVAKTAASGFLSSVCRPVIIGDNRVFENALSLVKQKAAHYCVADVSEADWSRGLPILDQGDQDPGVIKTAVVQEACGKAVLNMIDAASKLCKKGAIAGYCFAPFNKAAMKAAGSPYESEHSLFAEIFGVKGHYGELNVVRNLLTTRCTSHIPLKDVSSHLTVDGIMDAITLSHATLRKMGIGNPRIAVAGLNPHNGESGRCGREEIEIIAPAVQTAKDRDMNAAGPFSADTIFIKAFAGEYDSVVTMYHDQGQIALKLTGFEEGVTVAGGMPYPIATPAHGTAFDIAGKGIAKTSAFESALRLTVKMASG
ncbi:MAG: 4-hydroxythreonine-4-phosphate dehydrogenase PdxA [Treponema sp.]|nr:4-hydroxythreonine-4-phosphate dehydrogenase PdxA [Treponema sp.]